MKATQTDRERRIAALGSDAHWRTAAISKILVARLEGRDTADRRQHNLEVLQRWARGDRYATFGIEGVEKYNSEEALHLMAEATGCSAEMGIRLLGSCISPEATLNGLIGAAQRISRTLSSGGLFTLGTGHPGALLTYYVELARLIREKGGEILTQNYEGRAGQLYVDFVEGVAVVTDRRSLFHVHETDAMDLILENSSRSPDLALADHGFAASAINRGLPTVAIMDTNDPGIAIAPRLGKDVTIIPMDDSRPSSAYLAAVGILQDLLA